MKKQILGILFLMATLTVSSQIDTDAEVLLKKMAEKAKTFKTVRAVFEYSIENPQKNTEEIYEGNVSIKGSMFRMQIDESTTFSDGKTRWVYLNDNNEVTITAVADSKDLEPEERFLNHPLSLFTFYEDGFKFVNSGTETISGQVYTLIDLTPEDIKKPYFKIRCWVSSSNDLFMMRYFQKDATRISFKFKKFETNIKMNDAELVFDMAKYPNIEVIDLRE